MSTLNFNSSINALSTMFGVDLSKASSFEASGSAANPAPQTTAGFTDVQLQSINLSAELDGWLSMVHTSVLAQ